MLCNYCTGRLYSVEARNFSVGVYDGNYGFLGLNSSSGLLELAKEYYLDTPGYRGTVRQVLADLGIDCPADIPLVDSLGVCDKYTGRGMILADSGWMFADTKESAPHTVARATHLVNIELLHFLQKYEMPGLS